MKNNPKFVRSLFLFSSFFLCIYVGCLLSIKRAYLVWQPLFVKAMRKYMSTKMYYKSIESAVSRRWNVERYGYALSKNIRLLRNKTNRTFFLSYRIIRTRIVWGYIYGWCEFTGIFFSVLKRRVADLFYSRGWCDLIKKYYSSGYKVILWTIEIVWSGW